MTPPVALRLYLWRLWVRWIDVVTMKLSGRNILVSGTSSVLLPNWQTCKQGKVSGPEGSGFTSTSSNLQTAIIIGAIGMLHNLVLLANHLSWYQTHLACVAVVSSCVVWMVFVVVVDMVKPLYCPLEIHIVLPTGCICGDYGYVGLTL